MNLSKHFTLAELTATAVRGEDNTPSLEEVENLEHLCERVLEPTRLKFGPLHTTSGYRSLGVNVRIGGSRVSMHMRGCAWDGVPLNSIPWKYVMNWLIENMELPIDQVIYEFGRWIHIGTKPPGVGGCRRQALMIFEQGHYEVWNPNDPRVRS